METNYRAYSTKNPDAKWVVRHGRLRGCTKGNPVLVFGENIRLAEYNLTALKEKLAKDENITIINSKRGSFSAVRSPHISAFEIEG